MSFSNRINPLRNLVGGERFWLMSPSLLMWRPASAASVAPKPHLVSSGGRDTHLQEPTPGATKES